MISGVRHDMGQAGRYFRNIEGDQLAHWCPGCGEMHSIWIDPNDSPHWKFNGNFDCPTFSPSVKITGKKKMLDDQGNWLGDWHRDAAGKAIDHCCHYFLTDGQLQFLGDSTHHLAGQTVALPELPAFLRDL